MVNEIGRPRELNDSVIVQVVVERSTRNALETISSRERKSISKLLRPEVEKYAQEHLTNNETYPLTSWDNAPEVKAYPTSWKVLGRPDVEKYSPEELEEMRARLRQNADTLQTIIRHPIATKSTGARR